MSVEMMRRILALSLLVLIVVILAQDLALALGVGYAPLNETVKAFLLIGTTLSKILVIAAFFMHLRYERINLILITFAPLVLAVIMFSFTFPETLGNATHLIQVR